MSNDYGYGQPNWDAGYVEAGNDFPVLANGVYKVCITDVTHDRNDTIGPFVKAEFTILEGEAAKRKVWKKYEFANPDSKKSASAYQHWINICSVVGERISPTEAEKLKQRVLDVTLGSWAIGGKEGNYIDHGAFPSRKAAGATSAAPTTSAPGADSIPF